MVIDGTYALRVLNHHIRKRQTAGADPDEVEALQDVQDWVRGMLALDVMAMQAESGAELTVRS